MRIYHSVFALAFALSLLPVWPGWSRAEVAHNLGNIWQAKEGRSMRASSTDENWEHGNADARPIPPGGKLVIADLDGPGLITHIWFTTNAGPGYPRYLSLHFYWDDEPFPSVQAPLGDFFAVGNGLTRVVNSAVVQISAEGRAYNCFWPMPFRKKARLEVHNDSPDKHVGSLYWYVDWIKHRRLPRDTPYFHAHYRQEYPAVAGRHYKFLETTGRGHYVGTVYSVVHTQQGWFGEGDDFFWIDGEDEPSIKGTGTEDYFSDAWGFRQFNMPFHGVTVWDGYSAGDHGTAYRWHIHDPIVFQESLLAEIEHWGMVHDPETGGVASGFAERFDHLSSVAFWYQQEPSPPMEPLPAWEDRMPPVLVIEAETLLDDAVIEGAEAMLQSLSFCSGGQQVLVLGTTPDVTAEFVFQVEQAGSYVLSLDLLNSWDFGIYSIHLNDESLSDGLNLYAENVAHNTYRFGVRTFDAGPQRLRFRAVGADDRSRLRPTHHKGYYLGFDAIQLLRLQGHETLSQGNP